ncbi:hypothetical protein GUITHDRAFT_114750 [Guillardia theta CCMP2712]|uniref:Uncharacterized protein n=1 Tax=Guillardia theta (strain CCMP2712) TaxID=905079 RepID=L1ISK7_GUITC|nr:hypothetical protein GUITHDRAFT_114750 [Guillardia theta CCMP2712]EKX39092.1 hypothetical protein GUITHDRAFT_114750 [Guillardia theta CCMP2712]|eukprot:XP_005826072.1 hypothetical protein GUITHDRAFT_114750 [Guillardia theta CCMP2712]
MVVSAYEEERMARMAENKKIMMSLGIEDNMIPLDPLQSRRREKKSSSVAEGGGHCDLSGESTTEAGNKRLPAKKKLKREEDWDMEPLRRSTRLRTRGELVSLPDDWKEGTFRGDVSDDELATDHKRQRSTGKRAVYVKRENGGDEHDDDVKEVTPSIVEDRKPASSDSSRNLHADLHLLEPVVGRRVPGGHVKAGVMEFVSPKCRPKFSKYVGVQEWKNAIFLMMNIAYGNSYANTFIDMDSRMQVTYYLSEKTKPEAPIIPKLVKFSKYNGEADKGQPFSVHLFCRPAPESVKLANLDNSDYVYCGRLKFLKNDVSRCPIEFLFELVDYAALKKSPDFQALLDLLKE